MREKLAAKAVVLDFNRTVYDPDSDSLIEGAQKLLGNLYQRFPIALYCKTGERRDEKIAELGLKKFFRKIIFVEEKTPKDLFNIAEEFQVKPNEMVVIGDRIQTEIAAAKKAGCKTIWFKKGKFAGEGPSEPKEEPDRTVLQLQEVTKLIKAMGPIPSG